jgi:hypothetical protein
MSTSEATRQPLPSDSDAIVRAMRACSLPRAQWTHIAHLTVGTWHVHTLGLEGALSEMPMLIRSYNEATGIANTDSSGYHETLTVAYLREIHRKLNGFPDSTDLATLVITVLGSELADSTWPNHFWSRERLWSTEARRAWIEPDLQPLPC